MVPATPNLRPDDPKAGVVLGFYSTWPLLAELQIRTIRETCGPVPILVCDDMGPHFKQVRDICMSYPDVEVMPTCRLHPDQPAHTWKRIGHTGGDVGCLWQGVIWASRRKLDAFAKLSQRFIITEPLWLQKGVHDLILSTCNVATQQCRGRHVFPLRTEAMLCRTAAWGNPAVMQRIMPQRFGRPSVAEYIIDRVREDYLEYYWPWDIMTEDRFESRPGVLWHCANEPEEYAALAASFGLEMDKDFSVEGWDVVEGNRYAYG